jgi:hypothetical protein
VIIEGPNGNLAGHIAGGKFVPEAGGGKFPPGPAEAGTSVKGRGGAIAAHILISLLAGLGGSAGIISLTGGSLWPPPVTVNYPLFCWIVFWAAVTGYGIARAIGLKFPAFSCFLRFAIALAGAFVLRRQTIFALHLQRAPWWLDTALFLVYLAAYIYATVSLTGLVKRTDPNASTASAFRKGAVKTTPAIEYFFMLTFSSLLPAIVLYIAACLTTERLPSVWPHITGIYGFLWAYWALKEIFRNHAAARNFSELSMDQQLKYNIFASLNILMTLLLPPFLVLFLHWYFKWFPMMVPVIVALGVYSLLMIFLVVAIHGSKKTSIIVKNIKAGG